jgi:hypothetical protein
MTSAPSGPFIDTSLVGNSFETKQASLKKFFHRNPTPVRIKIVEDDKPEALVPIRTNAPSITPHVNIPGSTAAMPAQEFFVQLIETTKKHPSSSATIKNSCRVYRTQRVSQCCQAPKWHAPTNVCNW